VDEEMREPAPVQESAAAPASAELLGELTRLRRQTRVTRHAYWFPLVLFGVLISASAPFYIQPGGPAVSGTVATASGPSMPLLGGFSGYLGYYWLTALSAGLLLTMLWYRRHARQVGLATPARGYIITSAVLTVAAFLLPPLSQIHWLRWLQVLWPGDLVIRGTFPFLIIAIGLGVLAWAEQSRALAATAAAYTATALVANLYDVENILPRLGWNGLPGNLTSLPNVLLPALVLVLAGAAAFAAQRRHRTTA
jgi:hypothetical protein